MPTVSAKQIIAVADYDLDRFNSKLNANLLKLSQDLPDLDKILDVKIATVVHTTYPRDENFPVHKPYYTGAIYYIGSISIDPPPEP